MLKYLRSQEESFEKLRVLVIHSGGDSKRVPQYSALGKLFSPVPHKLPNGRNSTLFDEFMICMSSVPSRIREGMVLLSGDVLLLFNPLQIDYNNVGAAAISFKEHVETGKNHGVYLNGENGNVKCCLQKKSVETLRSVGAVNNSDCVDIDTGALIFSTEMMNSLYSLIATPVDYDRHVNAKTRLSLYADFLYPLAEDSTLEDFYKEKPEGEFCPELTAARERVWKDQVGGATSGLKYISSMPGLKQEIKVTHVELPESARKELDERFVLIYTGQRRLARNLLRDVVGRYVGNEPDSLFALEEIQKTAALMRFELERGNVDGFAKLLDYHWELSKKVDAGSSNTLIEQIFSSIEEMIDGRLVCGAGGGGFLQVILKKGITREDVEKRLNEVFMDSLVGVADCKLVW